MRQICLSYSTRVQLFLRTRHFSDVKPRIEFHRTQDRPSVCLCVSCWHGNQGLVEYLTIGLASFVVYTCTYVELQYWCTPILKANPTDQPVHVQELGTCNLRRTSRKRIATMKVIAALTLIASAAAFAPAPATVSHWKQTIATRKKRVARRPAGWSAQRIFVCRTLNRRPPETSFPPRRTLPTRLFCSCLLCVRTKTTLVDSCYFCPFLCVH